VDRHYYNGLKTAALLGLLTAVIMVIGAWLGGTQGLVIAFAIALATNAFAYWNSGAMALRSMRARPVSEAEQPVMYRVVREIATQQRQPMPTLHVSPTMAPNAFATGRNPRNASVCCTEGILQLLDERELRGVLAHELSHVMNRDILISSIAAAIGMSITFLARFAFFFGGGDDDRGGGALGMLFAWILAPIAAAIIQMAVSRSREYQADESGALLSQDPEALASALRKLEASAKQVPVPASVSPAEAHMFIVNPFGGRRTGAATFANLFSTHPPTDARVARLEEIRRRIGAR